MAKIQDVLKRLSTILCVIALSLMVLLVVVEILLRIFGMSTLISDEFAGYFMVVIVFCGATISFADGKFVMVDALYNLFTGKVKFWVDIVFHIVLITYATLLSIYIWRFNLSSVLLNSKSYSVIETPLYIPQFFMSLGILCFDLYVLIRICQLTTRKRGEQV
jgi:TRAP-type C4-dicarboxylate transport system permease small subunit